MDKYLWKFHWDCGSSDVNGLFIATEQEIDNAIGKDVYFGEILGKHSEVYGILEKKDLIKLDISYDAMNELSELLGDTWNGYNPLNYIYNEEN